MTNRVAATKEIDLFKYSELADLYAKRSELIADIENKKPRSHRRLELQYRLKTLNLKIMEMEV